MSSDNGIHKLADNIHKSYLSSVANPGYCKRDVHAFPHFSAQRITTATPVSKWVCHSPLTLTTVDIYENTVSVQVNGYVKKLCNPKFCIEDLG